MCFRPLVVRLITHHRFFNLTIFPNACFWLFPLHSGVQFTEQPFLCSTLLEEDEEQKET